MIFSVNYSCNNRDHPRTGDLQLPEIIDYNYHIKPIFSDRCYKCHGPDEQSRKADLSLHVEEGLFARLSNGKKSFRPRSISKSEAYQRIASNDPEYMMPPPDADLTLNNQEIALIRKWIEQGADWKEHWSLISPNKSSLPLVKDMSWGQNEIDPFIIRKIENEGLSLSEKADKETLIRRLTLDLTGLPSAIPDIENYLHDTSELAFEKVVDRLLSSSAFGERMAGDWMDAARYADSHGYLDDTHREAWHWRDWVIQAFNENLPYHQFVSDQLAGDLYPDATYNQRLATGFNRMHRQNQEGGVIPEEYRAEYVADRVSTTSKAFLGMTMECARCHDHKYDPISQKEFYEMSAFFNNTFELGRAPIGYESGPTMLLADSVTESRIDSIRLVISNIEAGLESIKHDNNEVLEWCKSKSTDIAFEQLLEHGLVAKYSFDHLREGTFANQKAPKHPAKVINWHEANQVEGVYGNAVQFENTNAILFGREIGTFERTEPFSFSLWVRLDQEYDDASILDNSDHKWHAYRGYEVRITDGKLLFRISHNFPQNAIQIISVDSIPIKKWTHLAITYDGSSKADGMQLFVDGKPIKSVVSYDHLYKSILHDYDNEMVVMPYFGLRSGWRMNDPSLPGSAIDELRIYSRQLSNIEVSKLGHQGAHMDMMSSLKISTDKLQLYQAHHNNTAPHLDIRSARDFENQLVSPIDEAMIMGDDPNGRMTYVLSRGLYDAPMEEVHHNAPSAMLPYSESYPNNRLGLAKWIVNKDHPLTARVAVNRIWQMLFGEGIVRTPDDFGSQGALPTHPELLDWLAVDFMESNWDVKALVKKIVMSSTYQQSSIVTPEHKEKDPDNLYLARSPRYRLSAEMIRDQALYASGLLVPTIGGPSIKPYQPDGLWAEVAFQKWAHYVQDTGDDLYRRTMYIYWKRNSPHPYLTTFDMPDRSTCTVKRSPTSSPTQSLMLLNYPQFLEAARALSERSIVAHNNRTNEQEHQDRLIFIYRTLLGKTPSKEAIHLMHLLYQSEKVRFEKDRAAAEDILRVGAYRVNDNLNLIEVASLTSVGHSLMNTVNFYMKT